MVRVGGCRGFGPGGIGEVGAHATEGGILGGSLATERLMTIEERIGGQERVDEPAQDGGGDGIRREGRQEDGWPAAGKGRAGSKVDG